MSQRNVVLSLVRQIFEDVARRAVQIAADGVEGVEAQAADRADARMRDAALGALARIAAVVPPDLKNEMETSALLVVPGVPFPVDQVDPALLRKAIRTERRLRLCYRDEAGRASERVVWPFALAFFDRVRLLLAWCELREDFRSFRTDRVVEVEVMEARYPARRQALLKTWREAHEASHGPA